MTTATVLITDALQGIGVLAAGQSPNATDLSDGLRKLNQMVAMWSNSTLLVPFRTQLSKVLTGAQSYTIGTGADIVASRPAAIESAFVRHGGVDYPVEVIRDRAAYDSIAQKDITGIPRFVYYEPSVPLGRVYVWYVGDASDTLYLTVRGTLTQFPDAGTDVDLADGYDLALWSNLAIILAPVYETGVPAEVAEMARQSKAEIKRLNRQEPIMSFDSAIPLRGMTYNIEAG